MKHGNQFPTVLLAKRSAWLARQIEQSDLGPLRPRISIVQGRPGAGSWVEHSILERTGTCFAVSWFRASRLLIATG